MLPMLQKHTVITAALIASLSLTACGKKTDVFGKVPEQTTEGEAGGGTGKAPAPKQGKGADTNGKLGGGLPNPNGQEGGVEDLPPLPEPLPRETPKKDQGRKPAEPPQLPNPTDSGKPLPPPVVVETQPAPSRGAKPVPGNYVSNDAKNVTRDNLTKRLTGGVTDDGLVYTSTSTDDLLEYLRARNERVGAESRRLNLAAAASVETAVLVTNKGARDESGDALVTLKLKENGTVVTYKLSGALGDGPALPLKKVKAGTTGTRSIDATIKCLDLDGGCETTFVRVRIGDSPSSAIINVVFRQSIADLYFQLPGEYSQNAEYIRLREFIHNSIKDVQTDNRVKEARMSSFEVVNGRSGVTLAMEGLNKELLAFAGPLLAPEAGTAVNINLSRVKQDREDTLDILARGNNKLNFANWIGQARLVANNGLGQVRVALKMRKRADYKQDQFAVTFMRKINPIVELNDENLQ